MNEILIFYKKIHVFIFFSYILHIECKLHVIHSDISVGYKAKLKAESKPKHN